MTKQDREHRKEMVIEYLSSVPVYRWAAKYVKVDEDTLLLWRKDDKEFSEACELAISEFVRKTVRKTKPEFQLERMLKNDFAQRNELTGKDGKDLPTPILSTHAISTDNSDKKAPSTD